MHEHTFVSHQKTRHTYVWSVKYRDRTEGPLAEGRGRNGDQQNPDTVLITTIVPLSSLLLCDRGRTLTQRVPKKSESSVRHTVP